MATCNKMARKNSNTTCPITLFNNINPSIGVLALVFVTSLISTVSSDLTIDQEQQVVEVGEDATFVCTRDDNGSPDAIVWTFSKNSNILITATINGSNSNIPGPHQRATNVNGTLKITKATEADHGKYVCSMANSSSKPETKLVVYVMPDYADYFYATAAVCLVLLIILIVVVLKTECKENGLCGPKTKAARRTHLSTSSMQVFTVEKDGKPEFEF